MSPVPPQTESFPDAPPDPHATGPLLDPQVTQSFVARDEARGPRTDFPSMPGYEIEVELGRGGMGVVYRARHLALKRTVALKVMRSAHANAEELSRFRSEATSAARLQHPNIVQIHEVGEANGQPYCALEFVEGVTLARQLSGTPQAPEPAARLVRTLALAIAYANQRGVIHRDLKPANILLDKKAETEKQGSSVPSLDFEPKIADFGLAKQLDDDSGQTQSGQILGTPSYMAPEQAAGLVTQIAPPTDVYALGAILYECLTGRPPFKGTTVADTLAQVQSQEPVSPSQLEPSVPRDLETICLKCLEKEPRRRYPTADALADDLGRYLRHEPILARPGR